MKLLTILLLTALPLLCYAGSGCLLIKNVVNWTINGSMTSEDYVEHLKPYTTNQDAAEALMELKNCFNKQDPETLKLVGELMHTIYEHPLCYYYKEY